MNVNTSKYYVVTKASRFRGAFLFEPKLELIA